MVAQPGNAINCNTTVSGLVTFDGASTFTTTALTQYSTLSGASANTVNLISPGTAAQVLTSNGVAAQPTYQDLPYRERTWQDKGTSFAAAVGFGYFVTATATATLPGSPAQGDSISLVVDSVAGILTILGNTGQLIQLGLAISAAAGTAVSNKNGDTVTLVYRASDTKWIATSSIGTFTIT